MDVGVVVLSHGASGGDLLRAVETLLGGKHLAGFEAVDVAFGETRAELSARLKEAIARADAGAGVVVVTDLYGATPSRCAQELAHGSPSPVVVLCGLSMPMLVKLATSSRETTPVELARIAAETARRSVRLADDGGT
jgi:mannose/fructose-specific phosphotransferase system component IIA